MRDALVDYYNTVEPINLRLSGVMTFFFAVFYFQYHFCRIGIRYVEEDGLPAATVMALAAQ